MKVKLFISAEKYNFDEDFEIKVTTFEIKSDAHSTVIPLGTVDVEIDINEPSRKDLDLAHVDQLKGLKSKIQAECNARLVSIDEKINEILSIEHKD